MSKLVLIGLLLALGCEHSKLRNGGGTDAGIARAPLDRLSPGELSKSGQLVFGFPIPPGMSVTQRYPDGVHLQGQMPEPNLKEYVEAHIVAGPSELDAHRRIYNNARIRGGDSSRVYSIEIDELRGERALIISDVTPKPVEPGLSNEERWRRAGYMPDGTPIPSAQSM
jgi:hypothetical protein